MGFYHNTYYGEYKKGIFEKIKLILHVYSEHIEGTGIIEQDSKYYEHRFNIKMQDVKRIEIVFKNEGNCIEIDYVSKTLLSEEEITIIFFNVNNIQEAVNDTKEIKIKYDNEIRRKEEERQRAEQRERDRKDQILLEQQKQALECREFYKNCYDFHIANENNPYYELHNEYLQFIGIYIDKDRNLNFVSIDGGKQQESNACISYEKIHYYEKAGSIHYATEINGKYSSYGGSFKSGTVSKKATIISGLLFGPMGMAAGALLTHKPTNIEMPSTSFDIKSEINRIDERSVILNYYSDSKKQFMDIELPADIYNFLQTHLPEKKYGIVLEVEKEKALKEQGENLKSVGQKVVESIAVNDDMIEFENKIKKLVIMHDNGLLSDEEFENEKKRILSSL